MQKMKLSLTKKTIIWIIVIAIVVGVIAIAVYNKGSYDLLIAQYEHYSIDIAKLVAIELDSNRVLNIQKTIKDIYERSENKVKSDQWGSPEFEAYVAQFEFVKEMEDYKIILADLQRMQSQLDVDCLYLTWVDVENKCYIYLVDAALEDACPPGCIDPLYFSDEIVDKVMSNLPTDGMIPNISKTEEYGWLLATGMPIFDDNGNVIAMAEVDISMNAAMQELMRFMNFIVYAFVFLAVIVCIIAMFAIRRRIIKPIITLSNAALQYKDDSTVFSNLNIIKNDEIGILANSMTQMGNDINKYINDLTSARELANEMDQVANTDALTKIFNKRAYNNKVIKLNEDKPQYGIALIDINNLKGINDQYGHEKGDISIKKVCQSICQVFDSSLVYRVGGDEFVVILENEYYEKRTELVNELINLFKTNEADDSLNPWERATASIGYAVYDSKLDDTVEKVEQRADAKMYENKKQWKTDIDS